MPLVYAQKFFVIKFQIYRDKAIEEYRKTEYIEHIQPRREQEHHVEQPSRYDERRPAHGSYEQKSEKGRTLKQL